MKTEKLADLVELLHANTFTEDSFKPMLNKLRQLTNSSIALMIESARDPSQPPTLSVSEGNGNIPQLIAEYVHLLTQAPYYHHVNQFCHGRLVKLSAAVYKDIQPQRLMDHYQVFDARYMCGVLSETTQSSIAFVINREPHKGDYGSEDECLLKRLTPHLKVAVENRHRLSFLKDRMTGMTQALKLSDQTIGIISLTGKLLFCSTSFYDCLLKNNLLSSSNMGQFQFRSYRHNDWLETTMNKVSHHQNAQPQKYQSQHLQLSLEPLIDLQLTMLNQTDSEPLFLLHLNTIATIPLWWRLVYCFTPKELALIDKLLTGLTLPEAAEQLQVSHNTVRTHLHNILVKTHCRSQNQLLVRLLSPH
jgi:DNA-binding CsgD family transcriptional regulator